MKQKRVDIIIVNFNSSDDTIECIESILVNSYIEYRIIIVDNASEEINYQRIKKRFDAEEKVKIVRLEDNIGFSGGNNVGINVSLEDGADYVLMINNDTIVEPTFLETIIDQAEQRNEDAVFTGSICYYLEPTLVWCAGGKYNWNRGTVSHCYENEKLYNEEKCYEVDFVCGCFWLMKVSAVHKIGFWPEEYFLYVEDLDYSITAKKNGFKLYCVPESVIYHKIGGTTERIADKKQYYMIRNRFYVIRKHHKGIQKISALLFSILWCVKRIIKGEYSLHIACKSMKAVVCGKMGKSE